MEEGRQQGEQLGDREGVEEFWRWAMLESEDLKRRWGVAELGVAEFTVEEEEGEGGLENVETGLRGRLVESEGEGEEEEEDEGGEGAGRGKAEQVDDVPPMAMDDVLRVLARGEEVKAV